MNAHLLDYQLKELLGLSRKFKLEAITILIDSIADDKAYDAVASIETEREHDKRKYYKGSV